MKTVKYLCYFVSILISFEIWSNTAFSGQCSYCSKISETSTCKTCKSEYCNKTCQIADWETHKTWCKLVPKLEGAVEVRKSMLPGAEMGLFARKSFKPNEAVAIYHGDLLSDEVPNKILHEGSSYFQNFGNFTLAGFSEPKLPQLSAQIANDPFVSSTDYDRIISVNCNHIEESIDFIKSFSESYFKEYQSHPERINVKGQLGSPVFIATRKIDADEEIFHYYGLNYWLGLSVSICEKKGLPLASLKINRAASELIEKLFSGTKINLKKVYPNYTTREDLEAYAPILDNFVFRFTSLLLGGIVNAIWVSDKFDRQIPVKFGDELDEISLIPNREFMSGNQHGITHLRSKILLSKILKEMSSDPSLKFSFLDNKGNPIKNMDEVISTILRSP